MLIKIESASKIYDHYIMNDNTQIKELIRGLLPVYSRQLKLIKLKYYYHWKMIYAKFKSYQSWLKKSKDKIKQRKKLCEDKNKWRFNYTYFNLMDSNKTLKEESNKLLFTPKINAYDPVLISQCNTKRYKTIEEQKSAKRNLRFQRSMEDIFCKVNLAECCKVTFPEYTTTRPFYSYRDIIQSSDTIQSRAKTVELSPLFKQTQNKQKTMLYTPNYIPKSLTSSASMRSVNDFNNINKKATPKGKKNGEKQIFEQSQIVFKNLTINSNGLSYSPSKDKHLTKNNKSKNLCFRHINLQSTLSDSKLLQLAAHYITTDESLEKFKLNMLK